MVGTFKKQSMIREQHAENLGKWGLKELESKSQHDIQLVSPYTSQPCTHHLIDLSISGIVNNYTSPGTISISKNLQ